MEKRIELHCHTTMSAMDGVISPKELIKYADDAGYKAIAITDLGNIQAFPEAYEEARNRKIKIIYGIEIFYQPENANEVFHTTLLVKNDMGLKNLYRLISISFKTGNRIIRETPVIFQKLLEDCREGLFLGSACETGELQTAIRNNISDEQLVEIAKFYDYLEIQSHNPEVVNHKIVALGEKLGILVVATGDVHFLNQDDEILRCIILSEFRSEKEMESHSKLYLKSTKQMLDEFKYLGDNKAEEVVIDNPKHLVSLFANIKPIPNNRYLPQIENANDKLKKICASHFHELYGGNPPIEAKKRLDIELDNIITYGFSSVFMITYEMAEKCRRDGHLMGYRGSLGASYVAFILGITEVNPLEYEIPYELFYGSKGDMMPVMDFNFCHDYQPFILEFLKEMLGTENVIPAGMIIKLGERYANKIIKGYFPQGGAEVETDRIKMILKKLITLNRYTRCMPKTYFIMPEKIENFIPLMITFGCAKGDGLTTITHYDYLHLKDYFFRFGLFEYDCITYLRKLLHATKVDIENIKFDDAATLELIINNYDHDLPLFSDSYTLHIINIVKPRTFMDLVKVSALSRNGGAWLFNAENLIRDGFATLNEVIVFRDDILINLTDAGISNETAFEIMESIGKGMGIKDDHKKIMQGVDLPEWYIGSCEKIKYLFPKAHAIIYAMTAFRIAWFKEHYPEQFNEILAQEEIDY